MLLKYLMQNWAMVLLSVAFTMSLKITGFRDKITVKRMYCLIAGVFLLSIVVFTEFYLADLGGYIPQRTVLMAVRYSATPLIVAMVLYTLKPGQRWMVFIPALLLMVINIISVFTGIVSSLAEDGTLRRGPLGYLPFIVAGLYGISLIYTLYRQSNRLYTEIVPIAFLALAFASGLILPFIFGKDFSQMFCTTIVISLYVFYVFSLHQLSKKDPLTDVLNLQAFYTDSETNPKEITALLSADMNGLKEINDRQGHAAGDEALVALARCFRSALKSRQAVYRIGGDEFVILCRHMKRSEVTDLIGRIQEAVAKTNYSCSIGCCFKENDTQTVSEMLRESDRQMYAEKAKYYTHAGMDRRRR